MFVSGTKCFIYIANTDGTSLHFVICLQQLFSVLVIIFYWIQYPLSVCFDIQIIFPILSRVVFDIGCVQTYVCVFVLGLSLIFVIVIVRCLFVCSYYYFPLTVASSSSYEA